MTEREMRDKERLITVDDYFDEFSKLEEVAGTVSDKDLDRILRLLSKALYKKYKYVINYSAPFRKKQGWLSVLKDKREEKRRNKEVEEKESEDSMEHMEKGQAGADASLPAAVQNLEILDKDHVNLLTEGTEEKEPQKE